MSTFNGFEENQVPVHSDVVGDLEIYAKVGGSGPGLLLIHGYPQCHQCVLPPLRFHPLLPRELFGYQFADLMLLRTRLEDEIMVGM